MKKYLLSFLIAISTLPALATYSIDWMKYPDMLSNQGTAIARDDSDNVYTTTSAAMIHVEKRDRFGNFKWEANSTTTIPFNYEYPVQVHVDPQGNSVVVGYRHTTSSDGHNAHALVVLKYTPGGNLLYKLNIEGSFSYFNNSRYWTNVSSQMDSAGNVFIGTAGQVDGYPDHGFNVIKVSPGGSIDWVSTKNFTSATGFHFVNRMRLVNQRIGLTGVTDYSSANVTTWVLDSTGAGIWSAISAGIIGKDITFDAAGNAFLLTWISISFNGDVSLYKFSPSGVQLWNETYDFGGSDLASRMEKTPDGNLAIMAYANSAPSGSYYVDWVTFKVDTSGTLLWSDRYDEHSNNDEIPYMMAVDAPGNIYVTGIGGPYPGGSTLSRQQMVTIKYSPAGTREWTSIIDTLNEYMSGVGIAVASDSSLFVLGDVKTFIIHYLDHTGAGPCSVPAGISVSGLTNSSATVSWNPVPNAYLYHVQYKTAASLTWEQVSTNSLQFTIIDLFSGTLYDYRVEAICNNGPTGYSPLQQFTTTGTGYCASMGIDGTQQWIDLVYIDQLLNSTPSTDSGYGDYTWLSVDLLAGNTYDITLSADMAPPGPTVSWKVWIDFNGNGDFSDAGEEVVSYQSMQIGWETSTFQVPFNATTGQTEMRVSMKNGSPPQGPCDIFAQGEVEDYTVNVGSLTSVGSPEKDNSLFVYSPGAGELNVNGNGLAGSTAQLTVSDAAGRCLFDDKLSIRSGVLSKEIHTPVLTNGIYFVTVKTEREMITRKVAMEFR